jgi:ribonuclease D
MMNKNTESSYTEEISKEEISKMPREMFTGKIEVVDDAESLKKALQCLYSFPVIGFDTETRPSFSKQTRYKMSLIQLSSDDICFLIRLKKFKKMPAELEAFLINDKVKKIGLSLRDDFNGLNKLTKIKPGNFVDLQKYVQEFGIESMSLQKIYAILFKKKISKRERLSNWESRTLTESQMRYAALDAWACLKIYQFLENTK